ncbi:MAG: hypothetical protein RLZZ264_143 [Bacillota bacterium]
MVSTGLSSRIRCSRVVTLSPKQSNWQQFTIRSRLTIKLRYTVTRTRGTARYRWFRFSRNGPVSYQEAKQLH